ncbi:MAG: hypothetical protein KF861_12335 [Planctomycetaceae bacterium]|nr:hypothetical protein [Planctomycetaceae bacterium]
MTRRLRYGFAIITIVFTVVEWLLFELVRIPYCPPHDMLTLFGTEKFLIWFLMGVLLAKWLLFGACIALSFSWTRHDVRDFGVLLLWLISVSAAIVLHPLWPVTPLNLLFQ